MQEITVLERPATAAISISSLRKDLDRHPEAQVDRCSTNTVAPSRMKITFLRKGKGSFLSYRLSSRTFPEKNLNYIVYDHTEILLLGVYPYIFYEEVVEAVTKAAAPFNW